MKKRASLGQIFLVSFTLFNSNIGLYVPKAHLQQDLQGKLAAVNKEIQECNDVLATCSSLTKADKNTTWQEIHDCAKNNGMKYRWSELQEIFKKECIEKRKAIRSDIVEVANYRLTLIKKQENLRKKLAKINNLS